MNNKHTPTPWFISAKEQDGYCINSLADEFNPLVAETVDFVPCFGDDGKANADFIVRAVNSHEALVEACKHAFHYFNTKAPNFARTRKQLKDAIAEAEGR